MIFLKSLNLSKSSKQEWHFPLEVLDHHWIVTRSNITKWRLGSLGFKYLNFSSVTATQRICILFMFISWR